MKKELQSDFVLCGVHVAPILIDSTDSCASSLALYAKAFANDVALVAEKKPCVFSSLEELLRSTDSADFAIIAGTAGSSSLLNALETSGKIDTSPLCGTYETYIIQFVENPFSGVQKALVIAGADQLGCAYGFFYLSGIIGVSPWYWFADAVPEKQAELVLTSEIQTVSKEPQVRWRGIFINDEAPSCTTWAYGKFGGYNEDFYSHVFELIIRLRGNCLWPAMWNNVFFEDGKEMPAANMRLASLWGVCTGTSHHEPLCRAGAEWQRVYKQYGNSNAWDYKANAAAITAFWREGLVRNRDYKQIITIGMRGENDSVLGGSLEYNILLLKEIITVQKKLLAETGLENRPQVLVVYKEVEKFWNGGIDETTGKSISGLRDWKNEDGSSPLDGVIIMLCEDNYGNVRSLPPAESAGRNGGWGMYYHFDYHGGPRDYMWLNIIQLEKAWEQLSLTYEYGVRSYWIVNVGDLKPMELPISFFMDMAFDGSRAVPPQPYYEKFVYRQFGKNLAPIIAENAAALLADYTYLNTICRPEHMREDVFSLDNFNEADSMLDFCESVIERASSLKKHIPLALKDAYFQLVEFPATASANICRMYLYYAKNLRFAAQNDIRAEWYARKTLFCMEYDKKLQDYYNNTLSGGKWCGLMSQVHYGYCNWNDEGAEPPKPRFLQPNTDGTPLLEDGTFLWDDGYVSIRADHFAENAGGSANAEKDQCSLVWRVIAHYGRFLAGVCARRAKSADDCGSFCAANAENAVQEFAHAPFVRYAFYVPEKGSYTVRVYTSPANNLHADNVQIRFAASFDDQKARLVDSLPPHFVAGDYDNEPWCRGVIQSGRFTEFSAELSAGVHSLRFYPCDEGLTLQKIVIYRGSLPESLLGPKESLRL